MMGGTSPSRAARLLFPALRWSADTGFDHERNTIELALELGVGGFCIFGGDAPAVASLTASLRRDSRVPLLIASDLERGAGQQFPQATSMPPLAAIGALDDCAITRRAAAITAREARAIGVNWILAPVADVDLEPRNPIVGSRAFGPDPIRVAAHVAAWIEGCRQGGALCCAKHFPGHGRTVDDSHAALPHVTTSRAELEADLEPFRAAVHAGVDAVMTAHVSYDALDAAAAATTSRPILTGLLRGELGFDGLIASDALVMEGMLRAGQGSELEAALAALDAGCDALLYPGDLAGLAAALDAAAGGRLESSRLQDAIDRVDTAARRAQHGVSGGWGRADDIAWADAVALRCIDVARGQPRCSAAVDVITIDDDTDGPYPPPRRATFAETLLENGIAAHAVDTPGGERHVVVALYSDIRAWKGAPGISPRAHTAVEAALAAAGTATVVFFGHRRLVGDVPASDILAAWGGEPIMQRAAARWLARHAGER
jgi:beta-glucosidase-like glycosyl hydrolase